MNIFQNQKNLLRRVALSLLHFTQISSMTGFNRRQQDSHICFCTICANVHTMKTGKYRFSVIMKIILTSQLPWLRGSQRPQDSVDYTLRTSWSVSIRAILSPFQWLLWRRSRDPVWPKRWTPAGGPLEKISLPDKKRKPQEEKALLCPLPFPFAVWEYDIGCGGSHLGTMR